MQDLLRLGKHRRNHSQSEKPKISINLRHQNQIHSEKSFADSPRCLENNEPGCSSSGRKSSIIFAGHPKIDSNSFDDDIDKNGAKECGLNFSMAAASEQKQNKNVLLLPQKSEIVSTSSSDEEDSDDVEVMTIDDDVRSVDVLAIDDDDDDLESVLPVLSSDELHAKSLPTGCHRHPHHLLETSACSSLVRCKSGRLSDSESSSSNVRDDNDNFLDSALFMENYSNNSSAASSALGGGKKKNVRSGYLTLDDRWSSRRRESDLWHTDVEVYRQRQLQIVEGSNVNSPIVGIAKAKKVAGNLFAKSFEGLLENGKQKINEKLSNALSLTSPNFDDETPTSSRSRGRRRGQDLRRRHTTYIKAAISGGHLNQPEEFEGGDQNQRSTSKNPHVHSWHAKKKNASATVTTASVVNDEKANNQRKSKLFLNRKVRNG